jgi:CRISPR/Cas system-associated exonuclease Cas4 (RecB family)
LAALKRNPKLGQILVEFAYLDHDKVTSKIWTRSVLKKRLEAWNKVGLKITNDEQLKPTPSKWGCRFCDYAHTCKYAINEGDL